MNSKLMTIVAGALAAIAVPAAARTVAAVVDGAGAVAAEDSADAAARPHDTSRASTARAGT